MPRVEVRYTTSVELELVWVALLDSPAYASYMEEVREIAILEQNADERTCRWAVLLKGSELQWIESEKIDHAHHRINFEQVEGDLAYLRGYWQVSAEGGETVTELDIEFDIGIPMMSEMLNPVAARALEDNSRAILEHIAHRADASGSKE